MITIVRRHLFRILPVLLFVLLIQHPLMRGILTQDVHAATTEEDLTPTPTETPMETPILTPTATETPTDTLIPTETPINPPADTPTSTNTPTDTATTTPTDTLTPTETLPPSPTPTATPFPDVFTSQKGVQWQIGQWYNQPPGTNAYNMPGMRTDLDNMLAAGIKWVRYGMNIKTSTSCGPTNLYLKLLTELNLRGMHWLATVTPTYKDPATGRYDLGAQADRDAYKSWLATQVNCYKDSVDYYEVWNEPNLHYFWNIDELTTDNVAYAASVQRYILFLQDTWEVIKTNDPSAKIVLGGISQHTDDRWIDEFIAQGGYQYIDINAFHPYAEPPTVNPNGVIAQLNSFKDHVAQSTEFAAKPIWITEYGFSASSTGVVAVGSENTKSAYLTDAMQQLVASGITFPIIWYNYNGDSATPVVSPGFNLVTTNFAALTNSFLPAYYAYQALWGPPTPTVTNTASTLQAKAYDAANNTAVYAINVTSSN